MTDNENRPDDAQPDDTRGDSAFERLQAADPAVGAAEPDLAAIRAVVDDRVSAGRWRPAPAVSATRWLRVAAAAVVVLAVGTAGYLVGTGTSHGDQATAAVPLTSPVASTGPEAAAAATDGVAVAPAGPTAAATRTAASGSGASGSGAAPAITLGGGNGARAASTPGAAPEADSQTRFGSAAGAGDIAAPYPYYGGFGRTVFHDSGLSGTGGTAQAWAYDPSQVVSAETAERLATALGVEGPARQQYGSWIVGSTDGSDPTLQLAGDGLASVSYYNPTLDPYYCPSLPEQPADSASSTGPVCAQRSVGPALSGDEAITKARDVLRSLGQDPAGYEFESPDNDKGGDSGYSYVNAYQVHNGQRTGQTWGIGFVAEGLSSLYGSLASIVDAGSYDVISAAQAVARLNDPRFGSAAMAYPVDYAPSQPTYTEPTDVVVPAVPVAGAPVAWPVTEVTITGSQLGVALQYQPDGSVLLLPAYALTDASGVTWSVVAVADSELNFASTP